MFTPSPRLSPSLRIALLAGLTMVLSATVPAVAAAQADRRAEIDAAKRELEELRRGVDALETAPSPADGGVVLPAGWVKSLNWRSIGPAGMGGRITAITVSEQDPSTWWVATASGGLLRTTNNGVTFEHQFDREGTVSIGDVAVAPSDANIVWVGTGESNPRNSVSYGDGVYKSVDGGKTFTHMGLRRTFQIGKIVIHPRNPDTVYVGAAGRLYGPSEERGVFKTVDGGKTWEKVLYTDERTGAVDVSMNPADPETLIACLWDRERDGFDSHRGTPPVPEGHDEYDPARKWGPSAGLYRTRDGGRTWHRLTKGLPSGRIGRADVDWYRKDPDIVYAIIDCDRIGMGPQPDRAWLGVQGEDCDDGARITRVTEGSPAAAAGLATGDIVTTAAGRPISSYVGLTRAIQARKPGERLPLVILRGETVHEFEVEIGERPIAQLSTAVPATWFGAAAERATGGVRITDVTEGSPAAAAGLENGDILTSFGGEPVATPEVLTEVVRMHRPGDRVPMETLRSGERRSLEATLSERAETGGRGRMGGGFLGTWFGAFLRDRDGGGATVARLSENGAAERAGLEEDDAILACDGAAVEDAESFTETVGRRREGATIRLSVERAGQTLEVSVKLEAATGSRNRPFGFLYAGQMPNVQNRQGRDGHEYGGVYRSADGGETWTRINSLNPRPMYFSQVRVDPSDEKYLYVLGVSLHRSTNGGRIFTGDGAQTVHADHHALWIDPRDGRHMIIGCDGGFYVTWDRGDQWEHLNHLALGQFYHVTIDARQPYRVYGGLQDNGSWGGPSRSLAGPGILNEDWFSVGGGDGFVCRTDPFDPDIVYTESQNGAMSRRNLRTGETASIAPRRTRGARWRFNWNTPFILSSHNPGIFYCAGNHVFRSLKRGDDLKSISPEISRTGRGTATALGESPRNADVLWVGTDDGNLWVTRDGGAAWTNVSANVPLPGPRWVATVEPSRFAEGRCYVALDGHRSNDDDPYLFVTEDFGSTWRSLGAGLPWGSTRCLREDPVNADLLFAGTEFAAYVSLDRGSCWTRINNNLPTVAVHELALHSSLGEVVAATHGRSLWILDISALRQMTPEAIRADAWLYRPDPVVRFRADPARGTGGGSQRFVGSSPPRGARLAYSLGRKAEKASIRILDISGRTVRRLDAKTEPGLHTVTWDLRESAERPARGSGAGRRSGAGGGAESAPVAGDAPPAAASRPGRRAERPTGPPAGEGRFGGRARAVPLGTYRVVLDADDRSLETTLRIEADPNLPPDIAARVGAGAGEEAAEDPPAEPDRPIIHD